MADYRHEKVQQYIAIFLLLELIQLCICDIKHNKKQKLLSRKKRYLNFPEGSSIVLNVSFSSAFVWEYTNSPIGPWNSIFEADIGFKLPNNSRLIFNPRRTKQRRSFSECYSIHRSERLELFRNIETLLQVYGVDGHSCVLRALCEAKEMLKPGKSLVEDLLQVVFTIPQGGGDEFEAEGFDEPTTQITCTLASKRCPFSLLKYMLQD